MDKTLLENIVINEEKLTQYLLIQKDKNDKSKFLSQAGYIQSNWEILEADLRSFLINGTMVLEEENDYGQSYKVSGLLKGPSGTELRVKTIWIYGQKKKTN